MQEVGHALMEGAPFSFINIAVLALVLAIVAERFVFILSKYRVNATEFMAQVRKLVQAGNIDRAIKLCEAAPLPLLQVIKAGLTQVNRGEDAVIANMEEKLAEVLPALEKRIASLWTFANLATLIGLLGTIRGLIAPSRPSVPSTTRRRRRPCSRPVSPKPCGTPSSGCSSP
jgi:biopolymer transport protein ExbB